MAQGVDSEFKRFGHCDVEQCSESGDDGLTQSVLRLLKQGLVEMHMRRSPYLTNGVSL